MSARAFVDNIWHEKSLGAGEMIGDKHHRMIWDFFEARNGESGLQKLFKDIHRQRGVSKRLISGHKVYR